jgi:hypothetical protein
VSKGQEAVALLQRIFGQPVEPAQAIMLMHRKVEEQAQRLDFLKNIVTAIAFDRGAMLNLMAPLMHATQCLGVPCSCGLDELEAYLNLPVVDLAEKVVGIAQAPPPGRIIT